MDMSKNLRSFVFITTFLTLLITACATPAAITPTSASTATQRPSSTASPTLTPTMTQTPSPTPIPPTPEGAEGFSYDPENRALEDPQGTPIFILDENNLWVEVVAGWEEIFESTVEEYGEGFEVREFQGEKYLAKDVEHDWALEADEQVQSAVLNEEVHKLGDGNLLKYNGEEWVAIEMPEGSGKLEFMDWYQGDLYAIDDDNRAVAKWSGEGWEEYEMEVQYFMGSNRFDYSESKFQENYADIAPAVLDLVERRLPIDFSKVVRIADGRGGEYPMGAMVMWNEEEVVGEEKVRIGGEYGPNAPYLSGVLVGSVELERPGVGGNVLEEIVILVFDRQSSKVILLESNLPYSTNGFVGNLHYLVDSEGEWSGLNGFSSLSYHEFLKSRSEDGVWMQVLVGTDLVSSAEPSVKSAYQELMEHMKRFDEEEDYESGFEEGDVPRKNMRFVLSEVLKIFPEMGE